MARYDLTDFEWSVQSNRCCRTSRGGVPRVDDRRVLNGIFWVLRSGARWADLPERYGPKTTCYNRFRRWTKARVWDRIMEALTEAYACPGPRAGDGDIQMIDGTSGPIQTFASLCSTRRSKCLNHKDH